LLRATHNADQRKCGMTKGEIISRYRSTSSADQHTIDCWLKANAVIASIAVAGVLGL